MKILKISIITLTCLLSQQAFSQFALPDEPKFLSASVIPGSSPLQIILKWQASDSLNVEGYIVYDVGENGIIMPRPDSVKGRFSTVYLDKLNVTVQDYQPQKYHLASYDNLSFRSPLTEQHTTMKLTCEYKKCASEVMLKWTEYGGWDVSKYRIYRGALNAPYEVIAEINGNLLNYNHIEPIENEQYYYYIEAVSIDNITATSNSVNVYTRSFIQPAYLRAERATVPLNTNSINVKFSVDKSSEMAEYHIQRANEIDGEYITIARIPKTNQEEIPYKDNNVLVSENIYYYRMFAIDSCGNKSEYSNIASNILLNVSNINDYSQKLNWTPYRDWDTGVKDYNIYRFFDELPEYKATLSPSNIEDPNKLEYSDNIEDYILESHKNKTYITNKVCYYIEAYKNTSGTGTEENKSTSNVACAIKTPIAWIPNAFDPVSYIVENRVFKPLLTFIEKGSYEFIVYNRWGLEIWKTNDPYEGWDGRLGEDYAPSQPYIYSISFKNYDGKKEIKTGTFNLFFR